MRSATLPCDLTVQRPVWMLPVEVPQCKAGRLIDSRHPRYGRMTGHSEVTRSVSEQGALFRITIGNRDYHHLSQPEIGGDKRISQHLSEPERPARHSFVCAA